MMTSNQRRIAMSNIAKREIKAAFTDPMIRAERSVMQLFKKMQRDMNDFMTLYKPQFDLIAHEWDTQMADLPPVNVIENDKSCKVTVDMPGLDIKDVDVSTSHGYLTVKGHRKADKEESTARYYRREISQGAFERTVPLPANADFEHAEATMKNGMLIVSMPKKTDAKQKSKSIEVKKSA
jgi:HSP20 family protein